MLFAFPWTIAHQAPLFMGFPRQEYWSGFPFPPPGDLLNLGIKLASPESPALASGLFTSLPPGKPIPLIVSIITKKTLWDTPGSLGESPTLLRHSPYSTNHCCVALERHFSNLQFFHMKNGHFHLQVMVRVCYCLNIHFPSLQMYMLKS